MLKFKHISHNQNTSYKNSIISSQNPEIEVENKAVKLGALGILLLTTLYYCMEIFIKGQTNYGLY